MSSEIDSRSEHESREKLDAIKQEERRKREYAGLIEEALREADGEEPLIDLEIVPESSTSTEKKPRKLPLANARLHKTSIIVLCAFLTINVGVIGFGAFGGEQRMTRQEAQRELRQLYRDDVDIVTAVDEFLNGTDVYRGATDPAFQAALDNLNEALDEDGYGSPEDEFEQDDFRFMEEQFYLLQSKRRNRE